MKNIKICSSGYYAPDNIVTNIDLEKIIDTSDEWITTRTGIKQRHISVDQNTSDLAYLAAKRAMDRVNVDPKLIRYIVVATFTPDCITPSTACILQAKLGLNDSNVMAFDINAACSGFEYALKVTTKLLEEGEYALVIGADVCSKVLDFSDRATCVLFGDGAGAMLLTNTPTNKRMFHYCASKGDTEGYLKANSLKLNSEYKQNLDFNYYLEMNGTEVFKFAVKAMEQSIKNVCKQANVAVEDLDYIIPHQANYRIIAYVAKKMKIDIDKFYLNVAEYGNTSAGSIPLAYARMDELNLLKEDMKIVLVGFGAGFTWAASYIEL
ncbi:MAG: beta-ketoacyl-ACP synthase III [Erysipelotrichaceae bacterium]